MNPLRSVACLILIAAGPVIVLAQDGWLLSATPPIVARYDFNGLAFHFTNTSDAPIHGVTLHHTEKDSTETSRIIIDTIGPHQTVLVDPSMSGGIGMFINSTVTCTNFSKPLKVKFP